MTRKTGQTFGVLVMIVLVVVILAVRLTIADGNWRCFFAQDIALCMEVSELK